MAISRTNAWLAREIAKPIASLLAFCDLDRKNYIASSPSASRVAISSARKNAAGEALQHRLYEVDEAADDLVDHAVFAPV
jgi:hypothetical protein